MTSRHAAAEVTIAKGDTWDAYVGGRAGAFISYNFGQAYPVPKAMGGSIQPGGGVDTFMPARDAIYETDAMGMPDPTKQGKLKKMRVRSGYYPNILTIGSHKQFGDRLKMTVQVSIWGTIESADTKATGKAEIQPANGIRDNGVNADFREGFLRLESPWGQLDAGRFLNFVGRGMTEIDVKYGHGYGVGFPTTSRAFNLDVTGDLTFPGPTGGMTGFGVLGASYSPGITYTTPNFAGIRLGVGLFDASNYLSAGWTTNRTPRPEAELTYDVKAGNVLVHLFGSGGFQKLYAPNSPANASIWAGTFGGRVEFGPVHLGGGGFLGKGAGINYAFDDNTALSSGSSMRSVTNPTDGSVVMSKSYEIRDNSGFFAMLQVAVGPVDIGGGFGQTQVKQVAADKAALNPTAASGALPVSTLKSQTGISAAVVYHLNENLHLDIDFMNGAYKWHGGESQSLNVLNGGATMTF